MLGGLLKKWVIPASKHLAFSAAVLFAVSATTMISSSLSSSRPSRFALI
jgi:hypothetical protein